jgi:hypothetical protein
MARQELVAVVVKVADERSRDPGVEHPALDFRDGQRRFRDIDGDAHHLGSSLGELDALLRRALSIGRVGHRHRLDNHRRAAADLDGADPHPDGSMKLED